MAIFVLEDPFISINSVDLSDHTNSVELSLKYADLDGTTFDGNGKKHVHGLRDDEFAANFLQDFAASEINATLWPLFANKTAFTVAVRPTGDPVSATNPEFSATCVLLDYQPLSGKPGDLSEVKVKFVTQTKFVQATS